MHRFDDSQLSERHRLSLEWFRARQGQIQRFPDPIDGGSLLATRAKGIYKPEDWSYALSVRIMMNSPYEDGEFFELDDGGWICSYHQETIPGRSSGSDELFTNRSLQACLKDQVPIGVFEQVKSPGSGGSRYLVRGLGAVIGKIGSYFLIVDADSAQIQDSKDLCDAWSRLDAESRVNSVNQLDRDTNPSTNDQYFDQRRRVWAEIVRRQGQGVFRKRVLDAYNHRCCITATSELTVLDAAHIRPYDGPDSNKVENGLLLRSDFHNLFDLYLLGIEPTSLRVSVHPRIEDPYYQGFQGRFLRTPTDRNSSPNLELLQERWDQYLASSRA